jgi:uncharacterized membrane protein
MRFIKTTIIGGLLFLVPVIVVILVVGKALSLMMTVAAPMAGFLPIESLGGVAMANIIAALLILLLCFLAGLLARAGPARRFARGVEDSILQKIPGYSLVKGITSSLSEDEAEDMHVVLVSLGNSKRVGVEIERFGGENVVVYFPGAPNAWAGTVHVVDAGQVEQLDCPLTTFIDHAERLGRGSGSYLGSATANEKRQPGPD